MNTVTLVALVAAVALLVERMAGNVTNPRVHHWWPRIALANAVQASIAFLGAVTWDIWLSHWSLTDAGDLGLVTQVALGYLVITFIYYWWHRARHQIPFLWRWLHQLHHSPTRMEVLMSFYKHPLEIVANGLLSSAILNSLLGLSPKAVGLTVAITGLAELFYHWNVRTPYWLGFVIQRPESHRIHHQRGRHTDNYSDLPLWDWMFGTFNNAKEPEVLCGFEADRELQILPMLTGKDVNRRTP